MDIKIYDHCFFGMTGVCALIGHMSLGFLWRQIFSAIRVAESPVDGVRRNVESICVVHLPQNKLSL